MALYGNNIIYSPDGILMFRANDKRANWYLSRGLAELTKVDDEGKHIRLLFEPNGRGHANDPYYLEKKQNICVVCGDDNVEHLTKHHVVPYVYRKFFPLEFKDRSSHDVLLLCKKHHYEYEDYANQLKTEIAKEYDAPTLTEASIVFYDKNLWAAKSAAFALSRYGNKIPEPRLSELHEVFKEATGLEVTNYNLDKIVNSEYKYTESDFDHGEAVVSKIVDFQAFVERWRQHFLDYAKPEYLSEHWSVTREIKKVK